MLLLTSNFLTVNYLEVRYLMHFKFLSNQNNSDDATLKANMLYVYDKMVKRKARLFFIDVSEISVNESFVTWFDNYFLPLVKSKLATKIAWLGIDFDIPQMADSTIEQKKFADYAEAMKWLIENSEMKKLSFEDGNKPIDKHKHH